MDSLTIGALRKCLSLDLTVNGAGVKSVVFPTLLTCPSVYLIRDVAAVQYVTLIFHRTLPHLYD